MDLTIRLDDEEVKILKKRAKKDMLELREEVEDIIRRSCINSKSKNSLSSGNIGDDKLLGIFSRARSGRKRK